MSLFFVAVGMSINVQALIQQPLLFITHVIGVLLIKIVILFGLGSLFGIGYKTATQIAFLLAQGGEFGFVLLGSAKALHIIDNTSFTIGIGIISLTMLFTPLLVHLSDKIVARFTDNSHKIDKNYLVSEATASSVRVILAGYGRMGHTVGTIFSSSGIPFISIDANPTRVAYWQQQKHPVYYGDISDPHLLDCLHLERIELVVMTLQNDQIAVRAAHLIRHLAPSVPIFARASDLSACDQLMQAGVTRALPETLEASLRLAAESLEILGIGNDDTNILLRDVRQTDYDLLRDETQ
jgi:glutathione-regulated potassium-efflux system protein KefB